jgi:uncharacterized protein (TIGR02231 family)
LYPGSATIVRTARIEAGATRFVVTDLSTQFATTSMRIEADPGIRIGQISTQDSSRAESANAAEAQLEARIQALNDQSAQLDVQAGAADIVKGYLERTGSAQSTAEHAKTPADAKTLTAIVAAISDAATDALARKQKVDVQKREIAKKVEALERDLQRVRTQSRDSRTVTIQLSAERAGNLRISYEVGTAGWRPSYRAELNSTTSAVALERMAQISQKTGEEWKNVKVVLSTAQPRRGVVPVTPAPWLLSYSTPQAARERMPMQAMAPAPMAIIGGQAMKEEDSYRAPTFQTDGNFVTEFTAPEPVTLASDGREVSFAIARTSLAAKQRIEVTPRMSTAAFVTAEADRPAGVWPTGDLQLYRDGSYIGAIFWNPQAAEKWTLSFGRDDLLQVKVDPIKADSGTTGVFDKKNVRQIADRITLRSNHRANVDVLVIEPTPVSTSDEIAVKSSFNPQPDIRDWEGKRGVVAWTRTLAPQQSVAIDVNYTIEYPKEGYVGGMR